MDELLKKHDERSLSNVMNSLVTIVFNAIDNELLDLQKMVQSGIYSADEILNEIERIRNGIY